MACVCAHFVSLRRPRSNQPSVRFNGDHSKMADGRSIIWSFASHWSTGACNLLDLLSDEHKDADSSGIERRQTRRGTVLPVQPHKLFFGLATRGFESSASLVATTSPRSPSPASHSHSSPDSILTPSIFKNYNTFIICRPPAKRKKVLFRNSQVSAGDRYISVRYKF